MATIKMTTKEIEDKREEIEAIERLLDVCLAPEGKMTFLLNLRLQILEAQLEELK